MESSYVVVNCFQIIIFVLTRTAKNSSLFVSTGCELLSNHYLCANKNSYRVKTKNRVFVVNCFQIIIFVLTRTAFCFLCLTELCCELLSNHYLCANKNSRICSKVLQTEVVNCFQIIIFVLTRTANVAEPAEAVGCELLSNHYLCANKNSEP